MSARLTIALLCSMVGAATAQCGRSDHPNCAMWNRNVNFCTNEARPLAVRQAYCPVMCGNLGCPNPNAPTTTTTTAAPGTTCAKWAADATKPFCANPDLTVEQKTQICGTTCDFETKPNADCVLYTVTDGKLTRGTPSNRTAGPAKAVSSGAVATTKTTLARAYAGTGCTVGLFPDLAPADLTKPAASLVGTATAHFFPVPDQSNAALSYTCTCV
ncbi:hypothetical protein PFISCL1PPCAC_13144 [Pristionchus fissidentatus]|uniref:ShKT domain-containing protein n=1 Tax=Pristionchus fissidentatus TaxID=1538716 RepID=A0AAV5VQ85_9BILA|nr:hypothetical protein PFISCL1PPCAC_13144 [Pristionchus fissidentatus]